MTDFGIGKVFFKKLALQNFRNIQEARVEPAPRLNVVFGDNGHGKTSLIEALYVLSTTRSFRAQKVGEVIQSGSARSEMLARTTKNGVESELRATLGARSRSFRIDDRSPKRRLDYALETPVIAFHPADLLLVSGPASGRRNVLDRVAVYLDTAGAEARLRYQEGLKERQKLLADKGPGARELDSYEAVIADLGARFSRAREEAARELIPSLVTAFSSMSAQGLELEATYVPGGTIDKALFVAELSKRRPQDARRGSASFGPQRDELDLRLDGRAARAFASQGQQRLLTLSLKVAELEVVRRASLVHPILLLDDVSSELDSDRTKAVFDFLRTTESQVFVTTTRPELFSEVEVEEAARAQFSVKNGVVAREK